MNQKKQSTKKKLTSYYRKSRGKLMLKILILLMISVLATSCVTVQPWQREHLADPIMTFDADPIGKGIQEHHLDHREGSAGGTGAQSGGCGCG